MKYVIALVLFLSTLLPTKGQPVTDPDSLLTLLKQPKLEKTLRLKSLVRLGFYYMGNDPAKAVQYADSAFALSRTGEPRFSQVLLLKGSALRHQGLTDESLTYLTQALEEAAKTGNKLRQGDTYRELATLAEMTSQLARALELNQKALDVFMAIRDTVGIREVYNSIGIIYWNKHEYTQAMQYYQKAIALAPPKESGSTTVRLVNNVGLIFQEMEQYDSALAYFHRALSMIDPEHQKFGYALINNNIGICYRDTRKFDLATEHFLLARKLQQEMNDQYGLALVNDNLAKTCFAQNRFREAFPFLKEGAVHATNSMNYDLMKDLAEHTAFAYEKIGDYRNAYEQQRLAKTFSDSLQAKSLSKEIADLEVKYKLKEQRAENQLLKSENDLKEAELRAKNLIVMGSVVFSVLVLALLILLYRTLQVRKKASAVIEEKNARLEQLYAEVDRQKRAIEEQKDEIASQNEELSLKNQFLQEVNREKNSLMGIVAHDLKAPFNSIGGIAQILPKLGPLNEPQQEFVDVINQVVESSRVLIQDIMDLSAIENREIHVQSESVAFSELLTSCVRQFDAQAAAKNIGLHLQIPAGIIVRTDARHLGRIISNLVSNALKFSNPGTVIEVGANKTEKGAEFYVKDQGPGISEEDQKFLFRKFQKLSARPTGGETSSGLGLSIVKGLVEELKGTVRVSSKTGAGTTFTIAIPAAVV